jgi:hypothetical protein
MLAEELAAQRTFLSGEEERALDHPMTYENEDDLAWDRVRGRRTWFFTALRDRFIRDGRPADRWRELVAQEEAAAGGEETYATHLARRVLSWALRTSDRGAMMAGFAARAARWLGAAFVLLGGWAYFNGAPLPGAVVAAAGVVFLLVGGAFGRLAARRVRRAEAASSAPRSEPTRLAAGT